MPKDPGEAFKRASWLVGDENKTTGKLMAVETNCGDLAR